MVPDEIAGMLFDEEAPQDKHRWATVKKVEDGRVFVSLNASDVLTECSALYPNAAVGDRVFLCLTAGSAVAIGKAY